VSHELPTVSAAGEGVLGLKVGNFVELQSIHYSIKLFSPVRISLVLLTYMKAEADWTPDRYST
jgi:hypothetical protein